MNFWDSSAFLPLILQEESSSTLLDLREKLKVIFAWTLTPVEIISALRRLEREGALSENSFNNSLKGWEGLSQGIAWIKDLETVKQRAIRLLGTHSLKAADSLQLSAALVACSDRTSGHCFVTLDSRLAQGAKKEGFEVLPRELLSGA